MEENEQDNSDMTIYLGIITVVNQIKNVKVPITDKIKTKNFKKLIFIPDIASVAESCILNKNKSDFNDCCEIEFNSGDKIKVTNSFENLEAVVLTYWQEQQKNVDKQDNK